MIKIIRYRPRAFSGLWLPGFEGLARRLRATKKHAAKMERRALGDR